MTVKFNEAVRGLLDGKNFATVATVNPDGGPQSSVVWVKRDGDTLLYSTTRGRRKELNHRRDPRISVSIFETENPYNYVEIRGTVELTEEGGRELIDELSNKYGGKDYPAEAEGTVRIVVRVIPEKITGFSA
ncbi:PPOX class probable F420-dependent enzyme [Amycolatopsis marina]|uniref:PPOX class probable F420-dependent enzyme n=1 Tax=Amycolatopsis marina TaxID=490629 RepID=A0A1I0Y4L4_9PSEU|nr:PPOX class F420-dependent oxidoreductase [Amycolatopsis marina]SFB07787.1 PPOX class probable F420-dependent enzyme [Amycolatopsis marina]